MSYLYLCSYISPKFFQLCEVFGWLEFKKNIFLNVFKSHLKTGVRVDYIWLRRFNGMKFEMIVYSFTTETVSVLYRVSSSCLLIYIWCIDLQFGSKVWTLLLISRNRFLSQSCLRVKLSPHLLSHSCWLKSNQPCLCPIVAWRRF